MKEETLLAQEPGGTGVGRGGGLVFNVPIDFFNVKFTQPE